MAIPWGASSLGAIAILLIVVFLVMANSMIPQPQVTMPVAAQVAGPAPAFEDLLKTDAAFAALYDEINGPAEPLRSVVAVPIPIPVNDHEWLLVKPGNHAGKHDQGSLPTSTIHELLRKAAQQKLDGSKGKSLGDGGGSENSDKFKVCISAYYSAMRKQFLVKISVNGICGGMVFRPETGRNAYEVTCFGGSECMFASCAYWDGVILRDMYVKNFQYGNGCK